MAAITKLLTDHTQYECQFFKVKSRVKLRKKLIITLRQIKLCWDERKNKKITILTNQNAKDA